jgi:DNA-binding NarL/FixJ family response regulator
MDSTSLPAAKRVLDEGNPTVQHAVGADSKTINLTTRQKSVLERLSHGETNKAIARRLGIREGTVKVHVRQIMRKLGVVNRTQVAIACANGTPRLRKSIVPMISATCLPILQAMCLILH